MPETLRLRAVDSTQLGLSGHACEGITPMRGGAGRLSQVNVFAVSGIGRQPRVAAQRKAGAEMRPEVDAIACLALPWLKLAVALAAVRVHVGRSRIENAI